MRTLDTLYIKTYGCQMNEYDSSKMLEIMQEAYGLKLVALPQDADVILLNTCSVREKAEEKVFSELGRLNKHKQNRPGMIIGVGGCVGQQEGKRIQQRAPYVDIVFGPQTYHRLPELVKTVRRDRVKVVDTEMPEIEKFDHLPAVSGKKGSSAFVTIMEGCDKFCTFCIVPYTRGPEISRSPEAVLEECRALLAAGVIEITLLGQNVNAYVSEQDNVEFDFTMLLHAVAELEGLKRLRFTTSHPIEMNDDLMEAFAILPQLMPSLHLPVQTGSDAILKAMHRGHTRQDYLDQIATLRDFCPDIALSSDFIVGYPGETDEDFEQTMSLIREVRFDFSFSFKYSPRPGTPAQDIVDDVPELVKSARLKELQDLLQEQVRETMKEQIGTTKQVLVECVGRREGDMQGRTDDFRIVHFQAKPRLLGQLVDVRIIEAYGQSLRGEMVVVDS
ncbi:MAG: tRNA (N6-isopentenyl adenosine(37)-C2)-methylthiotransferase MiaB [Mariprofundaceae bacterium]|nr:tRNA (N6-isopentenyl adenosine(37)-C2)-methylthiotransferase MiaB [Mariprofundaceae bacterium]